MPAFTFVASVIVAEIGGIALAAALGSTGLAFVTSVIATGLAYATARILGVGESSGGTQQDPGVRIQLPPATNNKVPIVYGSAYTRGVITDARISNENKTMTYLMILSEETQTGTFSVGDIYWNDQKLVFDTDPGESHIVRSSIDQNGEGESNSNYDGQIRVRVYAGSVAATDQIFPPQATGNTVNARTTLDESDTNYELNGLVFAVIQVDYNSEKGLTGLGQMTYQLNNTLNNPGLVWYDYMTSTRYGAGLPANQIDSVSSIGTGTYSLYTISNTIPANQYESDGITTSTQVRYQINGVLSTGETVRNNLEKINIASASWTTYDISEGLWKVIPNRAASAGELSSAFVFDDDNIIGDVGITATNLEDLYNTLEVEFPSRGIRDQNEYYKAEIPSNQRNDLEPENALNMRVDLVNNALHAARVGLIELKQSRVDLIITFRADFSALQVEAGDVIKVTNDVYGFSEKLFRVTKTREVEDEGGGITVEITALAYDSDVYADEELDEFAPGGASGIPTFGGSGSLLPPSAPVLSNSNPTASVPNFTISTDINASSGPVNLVEWFYSSSSGGTYSYLTNERPASGNFNAGSTVSDIIFELAAGTWYFKARTSQNGLYSDFSAASSAFVWNPAVSGGTSTTATNADQVFINAVTSGVYEVALTQNNNDYEAISGDSNLSFNASTNILTSGGLTLNNATSSNSTTSGALIVSGGAGIGGSLYVEQANVIDVINLSVKTAAPASFSTGTIAMANGVNWDPAAYSTTTAYLTYYNGTAWIAM